MAFFFAAALARRSFHATPVALKGRRGGSKAHLPRVRFRRKPAPKPTYGRQKEHRPPLWRDDKASRRSAALSRGASEALVALDEGDAASLFESASFREFEALFDDEEEVVEKGVELLEAGEAASSRLEALTKHEACEEAYAEARRVWRQEGGEPKAWCALLTTARRAKAFEDCLAIADGFFAAHPAAATEMAEHVVHECVRVAAETRRVASAWATFDGARVLGFCERPEPETYAALLRCCAVQQLPERALNLLDEMRRLAVPRDAAVYAALLGAVAEAPQWRKEYARLVDDVLDEMQGDGVAPTPEVYRQLIVSAGRCGDARAAVLWFDEMRARHAMPRPDALYRSFFAALAAAQSVGRRAGTKRRALVLPPWIPLGLDPDQATIPNHDLDPRALSRYVDDTDKAQDNFLADRFALKRRKDLKLRKHTRRQVSLNSTDDYETVVGTDLKRDYLASAEGSADDSDEAGEDEAHDEDDEDEDDDEASKMLEEILANASLDEDELAKLLMGGEVSLPNEVSPPNEVAAPAEEPRGAVTRLRELGNDWEGLDDSAEGLHRRQEAHISIARDAFESMECEPSLATLNAYFSVYTEAMRRKRARDVAETLAAAYPSFPDRRANRHLTRMLARRGELGPALASLDADEDDVETIGAVLDAFARKGNLEVARRLADKLVDAHNKRVADGVGPSDRPPRYPDLVRLGVFLEPPDRTYGPPERLLRAFRQLCRARKVQQPDNLPIDPILWRQEGARLRREKRGQKWIRHKRAMARRATA